MDGWTALVGLPLGRGPFPPSLCAMRVAMVTSGRHSGENTISCTYARCAPFTGKVMVFMGMVRTVVGAGWVPAMNHGRGRRLPHGHGGGDRHRTVHT